MSHTRRYSRLPFSATSRLTTGPEGRFYETELLDISLKGALVRRPAGLEVEVGASAVLELQLAGSDLSIAMEGTLVHFSDDRLGLHSQSIDMESMTHLRRLLELNLGDPDLLNRELLDLG